MRLLANRNRDPERSPCLTGLLRFQQPVLSDWSLYVYVQLLLNDHNASLFHSFVDSIYLFTAAVRVSLSFAGMQHHLAFTWSPFFWALSNSFHMLW